METQCISVWFGETPIRCLYTTDLDRVDKYVAAMTKQFAGLAVRSTPASQARATRSCRAIQHFGRSPRSSDKRSRQARRVAAACAIQADNQHGR